MGSTLDNISISIDAKFSALETIFALYLGYTLGTDDIKLINGKIKETAKLKENYTANTIEILKNYYLAANDIQRKELHNNYIRTFHSIDLIGQLDRMYSIHQKLKRTYKFDDAELTANIRLFEISVVDETFVNGSSDYCIKCKLSYDIEEKSAEYICKKCGHLEKLAGVVFEDEQFYYQEGQRTKHGKYDPIKHAKFWLERIQANENTEIPEDVIDAIKFCIKRDKLLLSKLSCETVRGYLKQKRKTTFNNHVPLIRKLITGIEPEQLTEHETQLLYMYFSIVIQVFNKVKTDDKSNCPYHPFFIYKIIEQILKKPRDLRRRREILNNIHLQSRETLIENDKIWFMICDQIPEFEKIPTDKR